MTAEGARPPRALSVNIQGNLGGPVRCACSLDAPHLDKRVWVG
jgi:hypothetical protein